MSSVNGQLSNDWIKENHPENGVFRVYYKTVRTPKEADVTSNPDEGCGLRWEWSYKDGKRADGISKGWWPDGTLKSTRYYKNGHPAGEYIEYNMDGSIAYIQNWNEDGLEDGKWIYYYEDGSIERVEEWKNGSLK